MEKEVPRLVLKKKLINFKIIYMRMGLNSGTSIDVSTKKAPGMSQEIIISSTFRSASVWLEKAN